jgi:hypothetical protein
MPAQCCGTGGRPGRDRPYRRVGDEAILGVVRTLRTVDEIPAVLMGCSRARQVRAALFKENGKPGAECLYVTDADKNRVRSMLSFKLIADRSKCSPSDQCPQATLFPSTSRNWVRAAQKDLDHPDIRVRFQKMFGEAVPQRVQRCGRSPPCFLPRARQSFRVGHKLDNSIRKPISMLRRMGRLKCEQPSLWISSE